MSTRFDQFKGKRVLLLQGPNGPFFFRMASRLRGLGAKVFKISFNLADILFFPSRQSVFTQPLSEWADYLAGYCSENEITDVILFGPFRSYHATALNELGEKLSLHVFDEGLIRPHHISLRTNVDMQTYQRQGHLGLAESCNEFELNKQHVFANQYFFTALFSFCYYLIEGMSSWIFFRHYVHHRPRGIVELKNQWRALVKKLSTRTSESNALDSFIEAHQGRYFFVPLQVKNDKQLKHFSGLKTNLDFLEVVMRSFSEHANPEDHLLIKQHPLNRPYEDLADSIHELAVSCDVQGRVVYLHEAHIPTSIKHAKGVVVNNSSVGMTSLYFSKAVIALGDARFDLEGLCFQGAIDRFWSDASSFRVDRRKLMQATAWLLENEEFPGSFYVNGSF